MKGVTPLVERLPQIMGFFLPFFTRSRFQSIPVPNFVAGKIGLEKIEEKVTPKIVVGNQKRRQKYS